MSQGQLYGGLITPHWNQIDYIHYGPAKELNNDLQAKRVLVGRYVLVKYLENIVYSQDDRNAILTNQIKDSNALEWKECWSKDGEIDCDGIVYIRTIEGFSQVARLNASLSTQYVENRLGIEIGETVKEYVDSGVGEQVKILIKDDSNKSVREIAASEVAKIVGSADEDLNTLQEISDWLLHDETGTQAIINRVAAAEGDIDSLETEFDDLQNQVDNLVYAIVIETDTLPPADSVATNSIYSIPIKGEEYRELYRIIELSQDKVWSFLGYTEKANFQWQNF